MPEVKMTKSSRRALGILLLLTVIGLATRSIFLLSKPSVKEVKEEIKGETVIITSEVKLQQMTVKIYPERRVPPVNNWGTILDLRIQEQPSHSLILQKTVTTNNLGIGIIPLSSLESVPPGSHSILVKGISHLAKRYNDIYFSQQYENFDFTPYGDLIAGDTHISSDNFINSLDISTLINQLNINNYKNDLNQDSIVNILDLTIQVDNISKAGDA